MFHNWKGKKTCLDFREKEETFCALKEDHSRVHYYPFVFIIICVTITSTINFAMLLIIIISSSTCYHDC